MEMLRTLVGIGIAHARGTQPLGRRADHPRIGICHAAPRVGGRRHGGLPPWVFSSRRRQSRCRYRPAPREIYDGRRRRVSWIVATRGFRTHQRRTVLGRRYHRPPSTASSRPPGFTARGRSRRLRDEGVRLAEDHFRVWSPATGGRLAGGPVITWASRTKPRLASSLARRRGASPHAAQTSCASACTRPISGIPALVRSIERTFSVAVRTHRPARYSELL